MDGPTCTVAHRGHGTYIFISRDKLFFSRAIYKCRYRVFYGPPYTRDPPPELHNREGGGGVIAEDVSTERFYKSTSDTILFLHNWTLFVGAQA